MVLQGSLDTRQFQLSLNRWLANCNMTLPDALNSTMRDIVIDAVKGTPVASRGTIEAKLRQPVTIKISRNKKTGQLTSKIKYKALPYAYALVISKRKKLGQPPYRKDELKAAATRMINGKLKAIGSLRSGWTGAVKAFSGAQIVISPARVKAKGSGFRATPGIKSQAKIVYNLNTKRASGVDPRVVTALEAAFLKAQTKIEGQLTRGVMLSAAKAGVP